LVLPGLAGVDDGAADGYNVASIADVDAGCEDQGLDRMRPAAKTHTMAPVGAVLALALLGATVARAEDAAGAGARRLTFYPAGPGEGNAQWAIGGVWQIAPMFTASYTKGLAQGFSADAQLQTVVLYTQLGAGGQWAAQVGPFSLGPTLHLNGYFGTLGKLFVQTTEFDSVGWGLLLDPGFKAGLRVAKDSWLTLKVEGYFSLYQAAKLGDLVVSPDSAFWEGFGTSLVVEYAQRSGGAIYYGVSLYNTRANYPLWFNVESSGASESVSAKKIWYLGLLAGYEF
jgi:hypothetical protein